MGKKNKKNQYHKQKKRVNHSKNSSYYANSATKSNSTFYQGESPSTSEFNTPNMSEKEITEFADEFRDFFRIIENDFVKKGKIVYEDTEDGTLRYTIFAEKDGSAFKICPRVASGDLLAEIGAVDVRISTIYAKYPYDIDPDSGFNIEIQADFKEDLSEDEVKERLSIIQECLSADIAVLHMVWAFIATHLNALLPSNIYQVTDMLNLSKDEKQYTVVATSQKILATLGKFEEMKDFVKLYNSAFA